MIKEVKFRGKDIIDHKWYYGYYTNRYMFGQVIYAIGSGLPVAHIVDPKTVGMWIGKVDRNGVEIYDNDIVRTEHGFKKHHFHIGVVEVDLPDIRVRAITKGDYQFYDYMGELFSWEDLEVIGDIFEPPIETLMLNLNRDKT